MQRNGFFRNTATISFLTLTGLSLVIHSSHSVGQEVVSYLDDQAVAGQEVSTITI